MLEFFYYHALFGYKLKLAFHPVCLGRSGRRSYGKTSSKFLQLFVLVHLATLVLRQPLTRTHW
jgi:hypothetical protein